MHEDPACCVGCCEGVKIGDLVPGLCRPLETGVAAQIFSFSKYHFHHQAMIVEMGLRVRLPTLP